MSHPREMFSLSMMQAGGVFYGGLLAAIGTSMYYIRKHHMPVLRTCDTFAPGHSIGPLYRAAWLFCRRLLLRQTHESLVGRDVHESAGEFI